MTKTGRLQPTDVGRPAVVVPASLTAETTIVHPWQVNRPSYGSNAQAAPKGAIEQGDPEVVLVVPARHGPPAWLVHRPAPCTAVAALARNTS